MSSNDGSKALNRLVFPKDTRQFGVWKDLIVGHLRQKTTALAREAMMKGKEKPAFKYEDLLMTSCEVPRPMDTEDKELMHNYDWQIVVLSDQDSYIRSLLSQTLPRGYLESLRVSFNDESLPVAWKRLEGHYGQSNAQDMATMIAEFDAALAMDFASVEPLIVRVKESRNRINRQSRDNLKGVTMIPNQYAAIKVLSLFPSQYWGNHVGYSCDGFHLDKVEALLRSAFMNKSRNQIQAMQAQPVSVNYVATNKPLGKRKWRADEPKKQGECFYCDGRYNWDNESHRKVDCPKMQKDRNMGLMRTSIFVAGKRVYVPTKSVGAAHVKKEKVGSKKKAKPNREEIPADVALLQPISELKIAAAVKASVPETVPSSCTKLTLEQAQHDTDEMMTSPQPSPVVSSSSSSSSTQSDDDFDEHARTVPALPAKVTEASSNIEEASKAIEKTTQDVATV